MKGRGQHAKFHEDGADSSREEAERAEEGR